MHPRIIAKRDAVATQTMVETATAILARLGLEGDFQFIPTVRDPAEAEMLRREALAEFLLAVQAQLPIDQPDQVTLHEWMARIRAVPGIGQAMMAKIYEAVGYTPPEGE